MSNIGNTMDMTKLFSEYQPTPEKIKSHQEHEQKRELFCKELEIEMREKWDGMRSNKSKKK